MQGDERGRAGSENGRRERPDPTTKGCRHPSARPQKHPYTSEHRAHRDTPRPRLPSDTTTTPLLFLFFFFPRWHREEPGRRPHRGAEQAGKQSVVGGGEREATGDGRPAGERRVFFFHPQPPPEGGGARRAGGGRRGRNREGHPSEPDDSPVPSRREEDTLPQRDTHRGLTGHDRTGGCGRAHGLTEPQRAPPSTRQSEAQRRGNGEPLDPSGRSRRTANGRERDHTDGDRRETGRRPTPGEKRRKRTDPP